MLALIVVGFLSSPIPAITHTQKEIHGFEVRLKKAIGKERVDLLNELTISCFKLSPAKGEEYGRQALTSARTLGYRKGEVRACNYLCKYHLLNNEFDQAKKLIDRALVLSLELNDSYNLAYSQMNSGLYYFSFGNLEKAVSKFEEALLAFESLGDKKMMATLLNNLAGNLVSHGRFESALRYHMRSLELNEELDDQLGVSSSLINIGDLYEKLKQYEQALLYNMKAKSLKERLGDKRGLAIALENLSSIHRERRDFERALEYGQDALSLFLEMDYKLGIATVQRNNGKVFMAQKKYPLAFTAFQNALQIDEALQLILAIGEDHLQLGILSISAGRFDDTALHLPQSLQIGMKVGNDSLILESYRAYTDLHEAQGDYQSAFRYQKLYQEQFARMYNEKKNIQLYDLQVQYRTLEREKENLQLKKDLRIRGLSRNLFIVGFILATVILLVLFRKYRYLFAFWKKERYVGRYRLLQRIGSGGMSVVYKAHTLHSKTEFAAVKILKEEFFDDESTIRRFRQESMVINKLDHPNIVKVYERGEDKSRLFMAMEYLDGKTLSEKIAKESPVDLGACTYIMSQLADALALIHAHKIIHRDLKPSNVMLLNRNGDTNFVKLLDFGLARTRFQSTLTKTGEVLGTIGYMSPEQLLDGEVTAASDVYSLGVIFYELVCGRKAFTADNEMAVVKRILDEMPAPPSLLRPEIPGELDRLILQMLEKNSANRPSLDDFRDRLHVYLDSQV